MFDRLIDLLKESFEFFQFVQVLPEYEKGVLLRFGKFRRVVEPGVCWFWPFRIDILMTHPVMTDTQQLSEQSLTTKDGVSIVISGVITYTVSDVRLLILSVQGAREALIDSSMGIIGARVAQSTWDDVAGEGFSSSVEREIRRRAKKYGIDVDQLQFVDLTKSRSLRVWNSTEHKHSELH